MVVKWVLNWHINGADQRGHTCTVNWLLIKVVTQLKQRKCYSKGSAPWTQWGNEPWCLSHLFVWKKWTHMLNLYHIRNLYTIKIQMHLLTYTIYHNLTWIIDLRVKAITIKLLEENIGEDFCGLGVDKN